MRKHFLSAALALLLIFSFSACGEQPEAVSGEGLRIVATVFPAFDFVREIAGERAELTLLVPPGAESHSFEPTPQDIIRLQTCDLLICNGGESEAWLEEIREGLDGQISIVTMLDCVDALEEEVKEGMQSTEHEEENEDEAEYDEHVWTSPRNAIRISEAICEALCSVDAANAEEYRANCAGFCDELSALDAAFREIVDPASRKTVIFADRFPVRYFTEEYGLDYYAAFPGCAEDTEPSARTVAFLIDRVREYETPAVFYIEFSNEKMADIICEDTGCKKLLFHSCHNIGADQLREGTSYLELMRGNVETLREALG